VVSFAHQLLSRRYVLSKTLSGNQRRSGRCENDRNALPPPEIQPGMLVCLGRNLDAIPTDLHRHSTVINVC
jgi:hypothetical protein